MAAVAETAGPAASSPAGAWRLAWRRLRRNNVAMVALAVLVLIGLACGPGAPLWVSQVSHRGPDEQNLVGVLHENGKAIPVVADDGTPIGPGLRGAYPVSYTHLTLPTKRIV